MNSQQSKSSSELAEDRTELALARTGLALERTLMAWLRTSLSMIGFGFTLVKFFEYLAQQRGGMLVGRFGLTWQSDTVGLAMVAIGTVALVAAVIQHKREIDVLRLSGLPRRPSLAFVVATCIALLGVVAFGTLLIG